MWNYLCAIYLRIFNPSGVFEVVYTVEPLHTHTCWDPGRAVFKGGGGGGGGQGGS